MNSIEMVHAVLDRLSAGDIEGALELFTDDVELEYPYRHDGGPSVLAGSEFREMVRTAPTRLQRLQFLDIVVYGEPTADVVVAEFRGDMVTTEGRPFRNKYISVFKMRDGLIAHWREYMDPVVVAAAFSPTT